MLTEEYKTVINMKGKKIMYKNEPEEDLKKEEIIIKSYVKNNPSYKFSKKRSRSVVTSTDK